VRGLTSKKILPVLAVVVFATASTIAYAGSTFRNEHAQNGQCSSGVTSCSKHRGAHYVTSVTNPMDQVTLSPWLAYAPLASNPASSSQILPSGNGWSVTGIGAGPSLDDSLSGNSQASVWPGTGVETTSDGGTTWTQTLSDASGLWGVESFGAQHVWAIGVDSLYLSQDAGNTWAKIQSNETAGKNFIDVSFTSASDGIAIDSNGNIYSTFDAGTSWQESNYSSTPSNTPMDAIANSEGYYFALDIDGNLWASTDGSNFSPYAGPAGMLAIHKARASSEGFDVVGDFSGQLEISNGTVFVIGTGMNNSPIAYSVPVDTASSIAQVRAAHRSIRTTRLNATIENLGRSSLLTPVRSSSGLAFVSASPSQAQGEILLLSGQKRLEPFEGYKSRNGVLAAVIHSVDITSKSVLVFASLVDNDGKQSTVIAQSRDNINKWSYRVWHA